MIPRSTVLCQAFLTLFSMTPLPRLVITDHESLSSLSSSSLATNFHEYHNKIKNNNNNNNNNNSIDQNNINNNNMGIHHRSKSSNLKNQRHKMSICTSATTTMTLPNNNNKDKTCVFHTPPSDNVDYSDNDTVFGQILRGDAPALVLAESRTLLAFQDIHPRAPLHGLIIPKRFVENIASLTPADVPLLQEMYDMAIQLLQQHQPTALAQHDVVLCFHVPPFTSVSHLHLHVLAPASKMKLYYRKVKYTAETRWCTSFDRVLTRLQEGESSSPYFPLPMIPYDS